MYFLFNLKLNFHEETDWAESIHKHDTFILDDNVMFSCVCVTSF